MWWLSFDATIKWQIKWDYLVWKIGFAGTKEGEKTPTAKEDRYWIIQSRLLDYKNQLIARVGPNIPTLSN